HDPGAAAARPAADLRAPAQDRAVRHPRSHRGGASRRRDRAAALRPAGAARHLSGSRAPPGRGLRRRVPERAAPAGSGGRMKGLAIATLALLLLAPRAAGAHVTVGSKAFPESWILGEALAR